MTKKREINNAMLLAAYVFNGEYTWLIGSCLTTDEENEAKEDIREAFKTLRGYGLSYKEVQLHVKRQANKTNEPLPFIDRIFIPVETDELPI